MITEQNEKARKQIEFVCTDDLVPQDHLLRIIDKAIDWSFIYDLVRDKYSPDQGRPSIDPVTLIKIPLIQYLYGIKSMRQTIKEIEVNVAFRWFLGLELYERSLISRPLERTIQEDLKAPIYLSKSFNTSWKNAIALNLLTQQRFLLMLLM